MMNCDIDTGSLKINIFKLFGRGRGVTKTVWYVRPHEITIMDTPKEISVFLQQGSPEQV